MIAKVKDKTFLEYLAEEERAMDRLAEAIDLANGMVDPLERYRNGDEVWLPMGTGFTGTNQQGQFGTLTAGFNDEQELSMARDEMRYLAATNPYAINAHENRISYVVGEGHTYALGMKKGPTKKKVKPVVKPGDVDPNTDPADPNADPSNPPTSRKPGEAPAAPSGPTTEDLAHEEAEAAEIEAGQEAIDAFVETNNWNRRQQETVLRLDRDGECFLRYFPGNDGVLRVRFVEPHTVYTPAAQKNNKNIRFGIEFDADDAETPVAYYINGESVDAKFIQHRKANVDCTTPRGVPLMWGQRLHLRRANKNVLNISAKVDVVSSISLIRKHATASRDGVQAGIQAKAVATRTESGSNNTQYLRRGFAPGTIIDVPAGTEYDAPPVDGMADLITGVALNLRCIASRLVMPEFMVSSDASNANYASTMVAEGPSVKSFERLQKQQATWDLELLWAALEVAGFGAVAEIKKRFTITVGMPKIISRDGLKDAQEKQVYFDASLLSPQEWSTELGYDYEKNQQDIEEHKAAGRTYKPGQAPPAFGGGFGGGGFGGPGDPNGPNDPHSPASPGEPVKGESVGGVNDAIVKTAAKFRNYP